jgi:hypothetical protein
MGERRNFVAHLPTGCAVLARSFHLRARQLIPMAQPDLDASPMTMRGRPPTTDTSPAAARLRGTMGTPITERKPKLQSNAALRLLLGSRLHVRDIFPFRRGSPLQDKPLCRSQRSVVSACVRRQSRPNPGSRQRCLFAAAAELSSTVGVGFIGTGPSWKKTWPEVTGTAITRQLQQSIVPARNKSPGTSGSRRSDDFTPRQHCRCPEGSVRSC